MSQLAERHGITPFKLFCAYYLGITDDGGYRFQNLHDVAKRFGCPSGVIKQLLADFRMDADSLIHSTYDLASAQVDVMIAPEGVSRVELARSMFEEFERAPRKGRDWNKELAVDARENEKIYGQRSEVRRAGDGPPSPDRGTPDGSPAGRGTRRGPRS
jgi:hypothetical protein